MDEEVLDFGCPTGTIFLIDVRSIDETHFRSVLSLIEAMAKNAIIQHKEDNIGIVFYNTQHSPLPQEASDIEGLLVPEHTAIFINSIEPTSENIRVVNSFKESEDLFDFKNRYGTADSEHLEQGIWLCSRIVMSCKRRRKHTIVLVTNNDAPYPVDSEEGGKCLARWKELLDLNVSLEVVPMVDDEFNANKFWHRVVCYVNGFDSESYEFPLPSENRAQLGSRCFFKLHRFTCSRYFNWTIGDGLAISCGLFSFAQTFKPRKVLLTSQHMKVISRTKNVIARTDEQTGRSTIRRLLPGDERKVHEVGGQKITITPGELTKLKSMGMAGSRTEMTLLGFKEMSRLPANGDIKRYRFMYPDEMRIKGSRKLFRALWERCIEKNKFAFCVFAENRGLHPSYVALVPQQRELHQNDGFRILYVATQDDMQNVDVFDSEVPEVSNQEMYLMKSIAQKLKFKYEADTFKDPYQMMYHATLEALAFEEEVDAIECPEAIPDVPLQDRRIRSLVDELIGLAVQDVDSEAVDGVDAEAVDDGSSSTEPDELRASIIDAITNDNPRAVTVVMLKEFLRSEGVRGYSNKLKATLITMARQHLGLNVMSDSTDE